LLFHDTPEYKSPHHALEPPSLQTQSPKNF
jgi:hypothetical protein